MGPINLMKHLTNIHSWLEKKFDKASINVPYKCINCSEGQTANELYQCFCQKWYWLIDYLLFMSPLRIIHLYGGVTVNIERLQNLGLAFEFRLLSRGGKFIA
jgi:hypothetical protein